MLRPYYLRSVLSPNPAEVNSLIHWCIQNPGYKNRYITKLQSSIFPSLSVVTRNLYSHLDNRIPKRTLSSKLKLPQDEPILNSFLNLQNNSNDYEHMNDILHLISDSEKFSTKEIEQINTTFINMIDISSGFKTSEAFKTLCEIWDKIFSKRCKDPSVLLLQEKLLMHKDEFTHILINSRNFSLYEKLVKSLETHTNFKILNNTWADTLATTFQFEYTNSGQVNYNKNNISQYLGNPNISKNSKRKLLSIFLNKGLLYSQSLDEKYIFIEGFMGFVKFIGDDHLFFIDNEFSVYKRGIRLMAIAPKGVTIGNHVRRLIQILRSNGIDTKVHFNFITSAMASVLSFSPKTVLEYWQYKLDYFETKDNLNEIFHHKDLKFAMSALLNLNSHSSVIDLYQRFPQLHNDDQIEVLLKVSELSKDWKLLQKQFEDMYGRGQLPFVIHYSLVMNALASIGAKDEVDELYKQLRKRNLHPTSSVYASLINSRLFYNDTDGANICFQHYLKDVENNLIEKSPSSYLYSLIFDMYMKSNDLNSVMEFLASTLKKQETLNTALIDSKILGKLINFLASNFGLLELEKVKDLAIRLNLMDEELYVQLIRAYIRLDQFEKANEMVYKAHSDSLVPFTSAEIYKSQLRNYRFWFKAARTSEKKQSILDRMNFIIERINLKEISCRDNRGLYNEVLKYYLVRRDLDNAERVFKLIEDKELLNESHFISFFRYYSRQGTFESYSRILELYRELAKLKVKITTQTYVHLMKALIFLDSQNNNGYENSYQLLQSVFDLNGFSMKNFDKKTKIINANIYDNSVDLCRILSSYVMATVGTNDKSINLLVHFLNQIKNALNEKMSHEFRSTIFQEMSRLYLKKGNYELAKKLVDNGTNELNSIINRFNINYPYDDELVIPKKLQLEYRRLVALKLTCMKYRQDLPGEYLKLLKSAQKHKIVLSGDQYTLIIKALLKLKDEKFAPIILSICEEYLISGNWVEAKIMRKFQFLYKLVMLHYNNTIGPEATYQKFDILNRFYDVQNLSELKAELNYIKNPLQYFSQLLEDYNQSTSKNDRWTTEEVLSKMHEFFLPERRISSQNKVNLSLLNDVWFLVEQYCNGDKIIAFKLMDEYPETMEYLLYNGVARTRLLLFRKEINKMLPPPRSGQQEDFESRRIRTIEALNYLATDQI